MWLLYFCFPTSDSVTKKIPASENDFLLSNLFLQLILHTSCMIFFSGCHLFSQIHPSYFLNTSHWEKIKKYSGKISFSLKQRTTALIREWDEHQHQLKGNKETVFWQQQGTRYLNLEPQFYSLTLTSPLVNISLLLLHSLVVQRDISNLLTNTLKMMGKFFHYSNKKSYFTEREVLHQCLKIKSHCFCKTLYWHSWFYTSMQLRWQIQKR